MVGKSIWSMSTSFGRQPRLQGEVRTDTVVIGGGMAGIFIAHYLKRAGVNCIVLEANRIGRGQTQNTTAKVTSQHGLIYSRLLQKEGIERAQMYSAANQDAIERYRILNQKYEDCFDWKDCSAYLYSMGDSRTLRQECEAATKLGIPAELTNKTELPFAVQSALKFDGQGQIHPLKLLYKLAEKLDIYEDSEVKSVEEHLVVTEFGRVYAKNIVFACHYPFLNHPGYYFMRMHQERSYVLAVKNVVQLEGVYYGIDHELGLSLRSAEGNLLVGGGKHRTGKREPGSSYDYLHHMAETYWPGCKETAKWSAQDCMTIDGIPYIGQYANHHPNWYVATGFGKWGMTSSMVSAVIISDMICNRKNEYAEVFTPQRLRLQTSMTNLVKEGGQAVSGLLKQMVGIPKERLMDLEVGAGDIVEYDGNKYGVYRDKCGKLYIVSTKCPHLGCQLAWNADEKSWDCPCHGSRFDYQGRKLNGPAQENLECYCRKEDS